MKLGKWTEGQVRIMHTISFLGLKLGKKVYSNVIGPLTIIASVPIYGAKFCKSYYLEFNNCEKWTFVKHFGFETILRC